MCPLTEPNVSSSLENISPTGRHITMELYKSTKHTVRIQLACGQRVLFSVAVQAAVGGNEPPEENHYPSHDAHVLPSLIPACVLISA